MPGRSASSTAPRQHGSYHQFELSFIVPTYVEIRKHNAAMSVYQKICRLAANFIGLCSPFGSTPQRNEGISGALQKGQYVIILDRVYVDGEVRDVFTLEFFQDVLEVRELSAAGATTGEPEGQQHYFTLILLQSL